MSVALTVIGVSVLTILILVSLNRERKTRAAEKDVQARRHTPEAEAQREESLRRRASVRAAHAERVRSAAAETDTRAVGSATDAAPDT
jgi:hypothetical protein